MGSDPTTEKGCSCIHEAARTIRGGRYLTAFTAAGVSVGSGIPAFRGPGGLWDRYDPRTLEIEYFLRHPERAWPVIREIFYDNFGKARPNKAHEMLAAWEAAGTLQVLITQNIDNLHHIAGSERLFWQNHRKTCSRYTRGRLQPP
jgi:NAD-dependent deacetylase